MRLVEVGVHVTGCDDKLIMIDRCGGYKIRSETRMRIDDERDA